MFHVCCLLLNTNILPVLCVVPVVLETQAWNTPTVYLSTVPDPVFYFFSQLTIEAKQK